MSNRTIIRAWKDQDYRLSLGEAERAMLPENPAGRIELSDTDLAEAAGGFVLQRYTIYHCLITVVGCPTVVDITCIL